MAYQQRNQGRGQKGFTTRLTGLFEMKSGSGELGTLREEDLENLIEVIKDAKKQDKSITFFVWEPKRRGDNRSLSVAVAQDRQSGGRGRSRDDRDDRDERRPAPRREERDRRPIADDPFDGDQRDDKESDDPFGVN